MTPQPDELVGARFRDRVCVVTGAGQGIGRAVFRRLRAEGGSCVAVDASVEGLARIEADGPALTVAADLCEHSETDRVVATVLKEYGRIDVLVNNVGGATSIRPFAEFAPDKILDEILRSLLPTIYMCRSVLPLMLDRRSGSIVNIGSTSPRGIYRVPYATAKGGIFALTTSLALETARAGIRVNCVVPTATEVADRIVARADDSVVSEEQRWRKELGEFFMGQIPMQRKGQPEEVASAVAYIASDEAGFVTGQSLCVTGGAYAP